MKRPSYRHERLLLLETNIDDMGPQGFELVYERLFEAQALDVWVETILMKKMRPAFKLSVLFHPKHKEKIMKTVFSQTPTLGVRCSEIDRFSLPRKELRVKTRLGPVRVKVGYLDSRNKVVTPEYEDLKRIARRRNLPFHAVLTEIQKELA